MFDWELVLKSGSLMRRWTFVAMLTLCMQAGWAGTPAQDHQVEVQKLRAAQAQWAERHITSYSFTSTNSCFCPYESTMPVRVTVEYGEIAGAVYAASTEQIPEGMDVLRDSDRWRSLQTVSDLFQLIEKALLEEPRGVVSTEYDRELGYPRLFAVTDPRGGDGWVRISITDLRPKK